MAVKGKHYSKNDRVSGNGHHCTRCKKPLSGSRIKAQKTECAECEEKQHQEHLRLRHNLIRR